MATEPIQFCVAAHTCCHQLRPTRPRPRQFRLLVAGCALARSTILDAVNAGEGRAQGGHHHSRNRFVILSISCIFNTSIIYPDIRHATYSFYFFLFFQNIPYSPNRFLKHVASLVPVLTHAACVIRTVHPQTTNLDFKGMPRISAPQNNRMLRFACRDGVCGPIDSEVSTARFQQYGQFTN